MLTLTVLTGYIATLHQRLKKDGKVSNNTNIRDKLVDD